MKFLLLHWYILSLRFDIYEYKLIIFEISQYICILYCLICGGANEKKLRVHYNINIIYYYCFDVGGVIVRVLQGMDV